MHFDEEKVAGLIREWLTTREDETFARLLTASAHTIDSLIACSPLRDNSDLSDVRQKIAVKLWRVLPRFDPAKGRAFTFVSVVVRRYLIDLGMPTRKGEFESGFVRNSYAEALFESPAPEPEYVLSARKDLIEALRKEKDSLRKLSRREIANWKTLFSGDAPWSLEWRWQPAGSLPLKWHPNWRWKLWPGNT